jgi:hypothetical protein
MVKIQDYTIDAAPNEEHVFTSDVTDKPVEEGTDITDHVRVLPDSLTIEGVVSNSPIGTIAALRSAESPLAGEFLPADDALAYLRRLRLDREPVTVETDIAVYKSMVLTSLVVPRSATTGDALSFRATFREIQIVRTERVAVPVAVPIAQKKSNRGAKQSETVEPSKTLDRQRQLNNKMRKNWGLTHNPSLGTGLL